MGWRRAFLAMVGRWGLVGVGRAWEGRWGPCAQYISLRHLLKSSLSQRIKYFDKVEKAIIWSKGLWWRNIALFGFVLIVNLLDLSSVDAQNTRGQQLP